MHRDIRRELQGRIEGDLEDHQAAFDVWRNEFNQERPHEALQMQVPASVYHKSTRKYEQENRNIDYPQSMATRRVTRKGYIRIEGKDVFLSEALRGMDVGLEASPSHNCWNLWFNHLRLAEMDWETKNVHWLEASKKRKRCK